MKSTRFLLRLQGIRLLSNQSASARQTNVLLRTQKPQNQVLRRFHGSPPFGAKRSPLPADSDGKNKSLVAHDDLFEQVAGEVRTKAAFSEALDVFIRNDVRRRGHVEFVYAALRRMADFGVERDLAIYNKLLDVFPKEVFVPRNYIQRMFNHYPRQQECGVQVLEQMETYGVMPNMETKVLLVQVFGEKSHPMRKFQRIMYWFPKFKNLNPFPVPQQLPEDPVDLARFSLTRIANDLDARVSVYQMPYTDITETGEEVTLPHIVGIQSPAQKDLLAQHDPSRPVFVEGPFPLWLKTTCVYYYVLRADPLPPDQQVEEPYDPERCFDYPLQLDLDLDRDLGDIETFDVDEMEEGPVFAMAMTSQGDQATLNQWISGLQQTNPVLGQTPTLFRLQSGPRELQDPHHQDQDPSETHRQDSDPGEPEEPEEETRRIQRMKQ